MLRSRSERGPPGRVVVRYAGHSHGRQVPGVLPVKWIRRHRRLLGLVAGRNLRLAGRPAAAPRSSGPLGGVIRQPTERDAADAPVAARPAAFWTVLVYATLPADVPRLSGWLAGGPRLR